jgi:hypothetical protein
MNKLDAIELQGKLEAMRLIRNMPTPSFGSMLFRVYLRIEDRVIDLRVLDGLP